MLTKRQKEILDFVQSYQKKKGISPSLKEIGRRFRLSSLSTIHYHVKSLRDKGYLYKEENRPRAISARGDEPLVKVPLLGIISAGQPIEAIADQSESIAVPKTKIQPHQHYFALKVVGQSMIDENINDGDVVLVRQQVIAENGEKVVALIDNYEATLKTLFKERGQIRLQPANKNYEPIIIKHGEKEIAIQGVVIDVIRNEIASPQILEKFAVKKSTPKHQKLPLNQLICGDAIEELKKLPSNSVDLVLKSCVKMTNFSLAESG